MKILLALTLLLASLPAHANNTFSVARDSSGALILSAPGCDAAKDSVAALRAWTTRLGESTGAAPSLQNAGDRCNADITSSVPRLVRERQGVATAVNGPNCWNTTLLTLGITQAIRFSSAQEMSFWMQSPYCSELDESEPALPGDVIAIRSFDPDLLGPGEEASEKAEIEVHGMTYLTPDLAWSKNSSTTEDLYSVQRADFIYQNFHTYACFRIHGISAKCFHFANYFRCANPSGARKGAQAADSALAQLSRKLDAAEAEISKAVADGDFGGFAGFGGFNRKALGTQLDALDSTVQARLAVGGAPEALFFWQAAAQEIASLRSQLNLLEKAGH